MTDPKELTIVEINLEGPEPLLGDGVEDEGGGLESQLKEARAEIQVLSKHLAERAIERDKLMQEVKRLKGDLEEAGFRRKK